MNKGSKRVNNVTFILIYTFWLTVQKNVLDLKS